MVRAIPIILLVVGLMFVVSNPLEIYDRKMNGFEDDLLSQKPISGHIQPYEESHSLLLNGYNLDSWALYPSLDRGRVVSIDTTFSKNIAGFIFSFLAVNMSFQFNSSSFYYVNRRC